MKKVLGSLVIFGIIASFSGCASKIAIASLNTMQVMHQFIRGETTAQEVRAKYGSPTEENLMTLAEAKSMFHVKKQDVKDSSLGNLEGITQTEAAKQEGLTEAAMKQEAIDAKIRVIFWAYNDVYTQDRIKRGARLMLIFDSKSVLVDYKFQKYNNERTW